MEFQNTLAFAQSMDAQDPLAAYAGRFHFPKVEGQRALYFTGNSLGLQPKTARTYVDEVMEAWAQLAVEGHFYAQKPWWDYHERLLQPMAKVVGASANEVSVMGTLTANLHFLMVSFYRPTQTRYKILCEEKAFPSDQYMLQSQLRFHGLDPKTALVEIRKREGEHFWRTEDILEAVAQEGDALALVLLGGVNYYNGQVLDMQAITKAGKDVGAMVGWDLAHAAGNVELQLHNWGVDFAAWCSYKYMNSGPGNASGIFVHQSHLEDDSLPRFEGWWGSKKETRFLMKPHFESTHTADSWQVSNPSVLSLAPYLASLELFEEVGMPALLQKQQLLTAYLEFVLHSIDGQAEGTFEIITPKERGCQLSVFLHGQGRPMFEYLMRHGAIVDWREPNVIRLAPAPFYNSFTDCYQLGQLLLEGIQKLSDSQ